MKTITKQYQVFKFAELSEEAQEKAINDEINFHLETGLWEEIPDMVKAVNKAERMQTPWFTGSYVWEYCKDIILNGLNDYEFLADGHLSPEEVTNA